MQNSCSVIVHIKKILQIVHLQIKNVQLRTKWKLVKHTTGINIYSGSSLIRDQDTLINRMVFAVLLQ